MSNNPKCPARPADPAHLAQLGLDTDQVWSTEAAYEHLSAQGEVSTKRTAERRLSDLGLWPKELQSIDLVDEFDQPANKLLVNWVMEHARAKRKLILFAQLHIVSGDHDLVFLHVNDPRGARYWVRLAESVDSQAVIAGLAAVGQFLGKTLTLFASGHLVGLLRGQALPAGVEFAESV